MKKLLLAFFSFLFAASAFAQDDPCSVWFIDGSFLNSSNKASDPRLLCDNAVRQAKLNYASSVLDSFEKLHSNLYRCRIHRVDYKDFVTLNIYRNGCEDECLAKQGKTSWQYVPMGKIKITNMDTGAYDFKRLPPPSSLCFEGCQVSSPGKYIGVLGMRGVDLENTDSDGYHTTYSNIEYTFSGQKCIEGDQNVQGKPPQNQDQLDEEKCKGKGGYFGQVNGKDVCLGVDEQNKCLPGQTYGQINGKDVCLTPEGDPLPVPKPGDENKPGNNGNGNGQGNGQGGNGQGNGQGSGGGGGGGGGGGNGNGEGDGEGDGAGPSFGGRPRLYEPKYKNGVKGVWDQKKGQMQNSGLGRLSKRLMPAVNSGTAPKWQIDMNWGKGMNFGVIDLAPPPMIWPILRAIVMVCALLLARRLVFGG